MLGLRETSSGALVKKIKVKKQKRELKRAPFN